LGGLIETEEAKETIEDRLMPHAQTATMAKDLHKAEIIARTMHYNGREPTE
jgi:Mg-chelatase subunit ChlI